MPTEGEAAEAQRVLTKNAVQLEGIDKEMEALIVDRDQRVQSIVEDTGLEIDRLRALVKEHQAALAAIEEQKKTRIVAINKEWKQKTGVLQMKRNRIHALTNVQHSLLASVRKLPSELLVNIFEHFIREGGNPWTLARVSVAWSKVVLSTCSFWSTIHVEIDPTSIRTANSSLKRLEANLRRAGTRTLLDIRLLFKPEGRVDTTKQIIKACALIGGRDMLARWRSVTLIQSPVNLTKGQLESLFAHPIPNLQLLSIESKCTSSLLTILLKMIDTSAEAFRVLSFIRQSYPMDLKSYPSILKCTEVLRCADDEEEYWHEPSLSESLSRMQGLKEIELPGSIMEDHPSYDWMRSVEKATFRLYYRSNDLFGRQKEYLLNLRRLSLIHCSHHFSWSPWIKIPNLRFLEVVGDLAVASCFDTAILDDLLLISDIRTRKSGKLEEQVLDQLCDNPSGAPKTRHLQLKTMASPVHIIGFLKRMPELERLTIQEHSYLPLSNDLFAALKEVEDVVHADGTSERKMVVCPTLQDLTVEAQSKDKPHLLKWVAEVVTVRRNLGETFEGVVLQM